MKLHDLSIAIVVFAGTVCVASPSPHRHHQHKHAAEKRSPSHVKVVSVPGPTVMAYELNGKMVTENEVCEGIKSGKLRWANGNNVPDICSSAGAVSTPAAVDEKPATTSSPLSSVDAAIFAYQKSSVASEVPSSTPIAESEPEISSSSSSAAVEPAASTPASDYSSSTSETSDESSEESSEESSSGYDVPGGQGLDKPFPDDEIDCSEFPSDYGAIEIPWMSIGGWAGIQYVKVEGDKITHIDTAVPGGDNCTAGAMCSYACPPGYQKSQWPSTQGATGQSVGGLKCNENGKLSKTNPELSEYLCIKGTGATTVQNKMSKNAAICRTDYPGTESETVPLNTQPNSKNPLTCPDSGKYFKWNNSPTSAQYYINNKGVPVEEACIWGEDGSGKGNWAPSYLGVGRDEAGRTWLAISSTAQNNPKSYKPLDYTVEIKGDGLSGTCRLSGGKYCSGDDYTNCNNHGCTVELLSGDAVYELSE